MAGRKSKKARGSARTTRTARIVGLSGRILHESFLFLALALVLVGFSLPWLVVETGALAQSLFGLPPSAALPAWRLPAYAREVESAWVVEVVRLFGEGQPNSGRIWWVYASPLSALFGWFVLRGGRLIGALVTGFIQGSVALFLTAKLLEGLDAWSSDALRLHFGPGLALATLGHALLLVMALETLGPKRRR